MYLKSNGISSFWAVKKCFCNNIAQYRKKYFKFVFFPPLLRSSAVELLINCLTSKESELWHSLGEAWYVPSEEWKGYVSPYRPVFMDGYSPSYVEGGKPGVPQGQEYPNNEDDIDRELEELQAILAGAA